MTRMIKDDKRMIARKAGQLSVEKQRSEIESISEALCIQFYNIWLKQNTKPADRKVLPSLSPLFVRSETVSQRFVFVVDHETGNFRRSISLTVPKGQTLRFPAALDSHRLELAVQKGDAQHKKVSDYENLIQAADKIEEEVYKQVFAYLESAGTVRKALAGWPDLKELFPERLINPQPKVHLPAFNPAKLNNAIGLPSKKTHANGKPKAPARRVAAR